MILEFFDLFCLGFISNQLNGALVGRVTVLRRRRFLPVPLSFERNIRLTPSLVTQPHP